MKKKLLGRCKNKRATIESYLKKIDWKLIHHGCDHYYFYNHKGENTKMFLLFSETDGRIEIEKTDYGHPYAVFYLKQTCIEIIDDNCVSFSGKNDKSIFINCANHDRKK